MAAPKKGRSASAQSRPGRSLALILIAIVALTGGMFLSGHTTPRLGIDLAGGTSITLTAKNEPGQPNAINKTNMNTAVDIMNRRVNGLGVSEAEVQTQGDKNIIVNIPKGTNSEQAREQVGTTAKLYFRPVLATEVSGTDASASPSPSASSSASPQRLRAAPPRKPRQVELREPVGHRHLPGPRRHRRPEGRLHAVGEQLGQRLGLRQRLAVRERQRRRRDRRAPGRVHRARLHDDGGPRHGR